MPTTPPLGALLLTGALLAATPALAADGANPYYELKQQALAVSMVPLDLEGDLAGKHLVIEISAGVLRHAKLHSAWTEALILDGGRGRTPAAAPLPSTEAGGGLNITGVAGPGNGCPCGGTQASTIHVTRVPEALQMPREVTPLIEPIGNAAQAVLFHWLELGIDTSAVPMTRNLIVTVKVYDVGVPLSGPPTSVRSFPAGVVIP